MRYLKMLIIIMVIITAMLFGIHNPTQYTLSFLSYKLKTDLPLWSLLILFFFTGMIPIFIASLPEKVAYLKKMRALSINRKELLKAIKSTE